MYLVISYCQPYVLYMDPIWTYSHRQYWSYRLQQKEEKTLQFSQQTQILSHHVAIIHFCYMLKSVEQLASQNPNSK